MASGIIVGSVFLATDQQLGVEQGLVFSSSDLVDRRRIKVDEDGARDEFLATGLVEEGLVGASITNIGFGVNATVSFQAMFEEVSCGRG